MRRSRAHVSTLPANRTERHIPAFPLSSVWDVGVTTGYLILFPTSHFEKHIHDTADLISGGDPGFSRSHSLTSGKDSFRFAPAEGVCRLDRSDQITVL